MDCREVEGLLPSYATHTLDPEARGQVEAHFRSCEWCAALARNAEEVVSLLAAAAPPADPPAALKRRVMAQATREAGLPVTQVQKTRRRWAWAPALAFGGAAALLLLAAAVTLGAVSLARASQLQKDNAALAARLNATSDALRQERSLAYLIAAPGTQTVVLSPTDQKPDAYGMMMVNSKKDRAILVAAGLDQLSPDRVYQAWLIKAGERTSAGVFRVDDSGWGMLVVKPGEPLTGFDNIGITEEVAPGAAAPTTARLLGGPLALQ